MSDIAVRAEGLSKSYQIGVTQERYRNFRDAIVESVTGPFRRVGRLLRGDSYGAAEAHELFWALRDISFEIKHGEVVGIIGRNGAGKSTLLKILSRITEPTSGYADIYGRVGALLEVGTGFHPELTGRENIYLNGTILGMRQSEIKRKFDEIVAFAEVEKFIDTPVKHYSSGMGLRLGFAVAAHLEPEILVVDEVLAVGDSAFQKKCIGKMGEVAREGRTVLFVSHNMAAVENLCTRAIMLQGGTVRTTGSTSEVIKFYSNSMENIAQTELRERKDRKGNGSLRFTNLVIRNSDGAITDSIPCGDNFDIEINYESQTSDRLKQVSVSATIANTLGENLTCLWDEMSNPGELVDLPPNGMLVCHVDSIQLIPSTYYITLNLRNGGLLADKIDSAAQLTVLDGDFFGSGKLPPSHLGSFLHPHRWSVSETVEGV